MNKVVLFDLDNTLMDKNRKVTAENKEAIRNLIDKGYTTGIISGRPINFVDELRRGISDKMLAISFNGSYILNEYKIRIEDIDEIISKLSKNKLVLKSKDNIYSNKDVPEHFSYKTMKNHNYYDLSKIDEDIYKINILFEESEETVKNVIDNLNCNFEEYPGLGGEITASGTGKGKALKYIMETFGFDDAYIFGDGDNDISMFELGYHNIVMNNARDDIKKYAELVVNNDNYTGVCEGIEWILENENK